MSVLIIVDSFILSIPRKILESSQQAIDGHWYLFNKYNGAMLTVFQNLADYGQDKVVYYDKNGQMLYGKQLINNHSYLFDTVSGALIDK